MLTYCTVPARYRRIRSNSPSSFGRLAGKPDTSDHTSGREPTALPKPSQSSKSPKPECASESSLGLQTWPNSDNPAPVPVVPDNKPLMPDPETLTLRITVISGQRPTTIR